MFRHGIDIVYLPRFKETFLKEESYFREKVFTAEEYGRFLSRQRDINHLAGVFASKEAVMKAFGVGGQDWLKIEIGTKESGAPFVKTCFFDPLVYSSTLSISHDGEYTIASVIFFQTK